VSGPVNHHDIAAHGIRCRQPRPAVVVEQRSSWSRISHKFDQPSVLAIWNRCGRRVCISRVCVLRMWGRSVNVSLRHTVDQVSVHQDNDIAADGVFGAVNKLCNRLGPNRFSRGMNCVQDVLLYRSYHVRHRHFASVMFIAIRRYTAPIRNGPLNLVVGLPNTCPAEGQDWDCDWDPLHLGQHLDFYFRLSAKIPILGRFHNRRVAVHSVLGVKLEHESLMCIVSIKRASQARQGRYPMEEAVLADADQYRMDGFVNVFELAIPKALDIHWAWSVAVFTNPAFDLSDLRPETHDVCCLSRTHGCSFTGVHVETKE
jgi:hypothetical protein